MCYIHPGSQETSGLHLLSAYYVQLSLTCQISFLSSKAASVKVSLNCVLQPGQDHPTLLGCCEE